MRCQNLSLILEVIDDAEIRLRVYRGSWFMLEVDRLGRRRRTIWGMCSKCIDCLETNQDMGGKLLRCFIQSLSLEQSVQIRSLGLRSPPTQHVIG